MGLSKSEREALQDLGWYGKHLDWAKVMKSRLKNKKIPDELVDMVIILKYHGEFELQEFMQTEMREYIQELRDLADMILQGKDPLVELRIYETDLERREQIEGSPIHRQGAGVP